MSNKEGYNDYLEEFFAHRNNPVFNVVVELLTHKMQDLRAQNDNAEYEEVLRNQGGIRVLKAIVSDLTVSAMPTGKNGGYGAS
jgi:ribonuclease D